MLAADMAGSLRLMGVDQAGTFAGQDSLAGVRACAALK